MGLLNRDMFLSSWEIPMFKFILRFPLSEVIKTKPHWKTLKTGSNWFSGCFSWLETNQVKPVELFGISGWSRSNVQLCTFSWWSEFKSRCACSFRACLLLSQHQTSLINEVRDGDEQHFYISLFIPFDNEDLNIIFVYQVKYSVLMMVFLFLIS